MIRENKFPRKNSDWLNRENKFPRKISELLNRENKFPRMFFLVQPSPGGPSDVKTIPKIRIFVTIYQDQLPLETECLLS